MAAAVEPLARVGMPAADKLDATEMQRLLEVLKMRLFLINSQAATTHGQIVVMEDALRNTTARRRPGVEQGAAHRTAPALPPLVPVRRRSKRAFAAHVRAQRISAVSAKKRGEEAAAAARRTAAVGDRCAVCLDGIADADCIKTECAHVFHGQCIDRWAAEKFDDPTCPVCRSQLFVPT